MAEKKQGHGRGPSAETLRRILEEFPVYEWSHAEIAELVSPKQGVISGFAEILEDVRALSEKDLGDIAPAGEQPRVLKK